MRKVLCTHRLLQGRHFRKISFLLQPHHIKGVSFICIKCCIHCLNSNHHLFEWLKDDFFCTHRHFNWKTILYVIMTHSLTSTRSIPTNIINKSCSNIFCSQHWTFVQCFISCWHQQKQKGTSASKNNKHIRWFVIAFNYRCIYVQLKTDHYTQQGPVKVSVLIVGFPFI